ncbi:hypothetical protein CASFOL_030600 [Castilleja foliolosa]|uniref:Transmembrane protein n=1 Tax=Castilleja foliolosa TaxID=1961234 RepID=A0ABD3C5T2_9LAMI
MAEGPETHPSTSFSDQSSSQAPTSDGSKSSNGNIPSFPIMYPAFVPGLIPPYQDQEQINRGPGLYAVPVMPYGQPFSGFQPNTLIPFTYNIPTEAGAGEQGQAGGQPQQQQQAGPQRQVVIRRFQIAIQLDLLLILKLAAVIFLFNQDGSKQRLTLLVFFASIVYLYQTGALAPVVRWLSQGMRRAAAPPQPPRPPAAAAAAPANENNVGIPAAGENENEEANGDNNRGGIENEHADEAEAGNRWWGIAKEIQMIVFGFITSLLPGFHNIDQ